MYCFDWATLMYYFIRNYILFCIWNSVRFYVNRKKSTIRSNVSIQYRGVHTLYCYTSASLWIIGETVGRTGQERLHLVHHGHESNDVSSLIALHPIHLLLWTFGRLFFFSFFPPFFLPLFQTQKHRNDAIIKWLKSVNCYMLI